MCIACPDAIMLGKLKIGTINKLKLNNTLGGCRK